MDQIRMTGTHGNRAERITPFRGISRPSPPPRLVGVALLSWVVALASGCAVTEETKRSLAGYVQAMDQVEQAANEFLTDFSDGLKVQAKLQRVASPDKSPDRPEYPTEFVVPGDPSIPQTETEKALASTRQALVVIRQYNDALVALAEGQPESEIRARTEEFGGALQTLVSMAEASIPGIGAFTLLGPKIIKLAQDAANREQLEQAVNEGREPVGVILAALEAQTTPMYALSVVGTVQGQTDLRNKIRRAAFPLKTLLSLHSPPTDPALAGEVASFQAELAEIGDRTGTRGAFAIPFPFASGKPVYNAAVHAETKVFIQAIRSSDQKYAELVAKQNAYYNLMNKYVATLRQTRRSLDLVAASLAKPVDLRSEVDRLLKVAFELRDAMSEFRNPSVATVAQ
jgi:hypothetical protein